MSVNLSKNAVNLTFIITIVIVGALGKDGVCRTDAADKATSDCQDEKFDCDRQIRLPDIEDFWIDKPKV
jgi:hypothetical protein